MMSKNIVNWFRISNWKDLSFRYRLVDVVLEGVGNDPKMINRAFFDAVNHLTYSTKGPVSYITCEGKRYLAVKHDASLIKETIPGSPLNITLTPIDEVFTLNVNSLNSFNLEFALRIIENNIRYQFKKNNILWDGGTNTFLKKKSLPLSQDIKTDIYHGFKFKVVAENNENLFICVDLAYKYVDKRNLHEILKTIPKEKYNELVFNKNFLYLNGDDWYTVKGKSIGADISQHILTTDEEEIYLYDYILTKGKYAHAKYRLPLMRESETLFYSYTNNSNKTFPGAACLAKPLNFAENLLHKNSINEPNDRFRRIEYHIRNYFQELYLNGIKLDIDYKPFAKTAKQFQLPSLKYGKNAVLSPYEGDVNYGAPIDHFPKRRREFIYKNGILNGDPFSNQIIFVPDNLPLNLGKSVKYYLENILTKIAPQFPGFTLHNYPMRSFPFAHKVYTDLKEYIKTNNLGGSSAIFILPEYTSDGGRFNKAFHNVIKKELFDSVKIKCVNASKLFNYLKLGANSKYPLSYQVPDNKMRDFKSYLANTIFEFLIINRRWPYAFEKNLNHDLYIGIDAHDFFAGFCFFFSNGEKIVFNTKKVVKSVGSFRNEKIRYNIIADEIVAVLSRHLKIGNPQPQSIIILRDGKSFGDEEKALLLALQQLEAQYNIERESIRTGVINIAKSTSIPMRAASFNSKNNSLTNPNCGTYYPVSNADTFLFNTGAPYQIVGSSYPLYISLVNGNIDYEKALEDIFKLTQITFSSPDRPSSLPLPLKLIDTLIRDVAHENDFANVQHSESAILE